ncbi:AraC family transcriptional regulator [Paenibacillus germinis]|uniref:AraC family transcriptional regulator n=1 Tax=Paenibacillus germinis TaxID=2654979 RepID=UPI0014928527|nr:AraC family transcriptional regulator [Paenibacillus germinis]
MFCTSTPSYNNREPSETEVVPISINDLNTFALDFQESEATFHVYYWGDIKEHFTHSLHKHSFFECCYITSGEGFYIDDSLRYDLHAGDCFLSKPGVWHRIEGTPGVGIGLVYFAFELMEQRSSTEFVSGYHRLLNTNRVLVQAETPSTMADLWRTLMNARHSGTSNPQMLKHIAYSLILSVFQLFLDEDDHRKTAIKPSESILLSQAKLYIRDNLSIRIKFQDLAKHLHTSERQLSRLFKDELNESFSDYYRKVKIQAATSLLKTTGFSLKQIAELTGFYSIHHFTKAYKQATEYNPGQWRKMEQSSACEIPLAKHPPFGSPSR